jgi:hypothetical protein
MLNPHGREPMDPFLYEEGLAILPEENGANKGKMPLLPTSRHRGLCAVARDQSPTCPAWGMITPRCRFRFRYRFDLVDSITITNTNTNTNTKEKVRGERSARESSLKGCRKIAPANGRGYPGIA